MTSGSPDSLLTVEQTLRGAPWSQEAEQAVLGAMILDQDAALSAADCGLAEGAVTLVRTSSRSWTLGGAAISASFGRSSVRVAAGLFPDQPPEILVSTFALSGAGPRATQRRSGALGVDVSTGTLTHVDGFAGVELSNADGSGSCFVTFDLEVQR